MLNSINLDYRCSSAFAGPHGQELEEAENLELREAHQRRHSKHTCGARAPELLECEHDLDRKLCAGEVRRVGPQNVPVLQSNQHKRQRVPAHPQEHEPRDPRRQCLSLSVQESQVRGLCQLDL